MLKKLKKFSSLFMFIYIGIQWVLLKVYSAAPVVNCIWLPWCADSEVSNPLPSEISKNIWTTFVTNIISEMIQYVAVIAVLSLMFSWIMYLVSWWEEEKTKRAKNWIMWSLIGVFLSISAYGIVKIINNLSF